MNNQSNLDIQTVEPHPEAMLTIHPAGKLMVALRVDGTLEYGPDYKPDEAARCFWNSMRELMLSPYYPPLSGYTTDELRDELSRRERKH